MVDFIKAAVFAVAAACVSESNHGNEAVSVGMPGMNPGNRPEVALPCYVKNQSRISGQPFLLRRNSGVDHRTNYMSPTSFVSASGMCVSDLNQDNRPDLLFPQNPAPILYRGEASGNFSAVASSGLQGPASPTGCLIYDYDGDGWRDILLTGDGLRLFRNTGNDMTFQEVTAEAGLRAVPCLSWTASAADFDGDGDLDLVNFCYTEIGRDPAKDGFPHYRNPIYIYEDGRYAEEGEQRFLGDPMERPTYVGSAVDMNGDGLPDIHEGNDVRFVHDRFWLNIGDGYFENRTKEYGLDRSVDDMSSNVEDFDNNGVLDYATSDYAEHPVVRMFQCGLHDGGSFCEDRTEDLGFDVVQDSTGWGLGAADFDKDGDLDLLVATGGTLAPGNDSLPSITRNLLFTNEGEQGFSVYRPQSPDDILATEGSSGGVGVGDFDGDGDPDAVIVSMQEAPFILENHMGGGNRSLEVELACAPPNPDCIGARVKVTPENNCPLERQRVAGSGFGGNSLIRLHFGLGRAATANVKVIFPDGETRMLEDVPGDQVLEISQ